MVYALYELTEEEIGIVEGVVWLGYSSCDPFIPMSDGFSFLE